MGNKDDYIEIVKQARLGDEKSVNHLAELARERLRAYIYRLTLDEDLTQDILQETMLEMLKFLNKLERVDRFWPWLFRIAGNKLRDHRDHERLRKTTLMSKKPDVDSADKKQGLENLVGQELKQIVSAAMSALRPRHRKVLILRCYEEMTYSEISQVLDCSEFAARRLFYRAKKTLAKQLSRRGLGKGSLVMALCLFGKMTASSEAIAAQVSVTAAATEGGLLMGLAALATSKTTIVSLTAAGALAVGTIVATSRPEKTSVGSDKDSTTTSQAMNPQGRVTDGIEECRYFFPEGAAEPVMMRLMMSNTSGKQSYYRCLQNQHANYWYDNRKNIVFMKNYRMWERNLSVRRLPIDSSALSEFISKVEGRPANMEFISSRKKGLLVISKRRSDDSRIWRVDRHVNILGEEYFQFNCPESARIVDNRDAMHQRGWTYFQITGRISGKAISGSGRIPFVYATSKRFSPWLKLLLADGSKIVDSGTAACVYERSGKAVARYKGGSFFKGLGRPWMGLHTIDTVRRDAAEKQVWFETKQVPGSSKAEVVLMSEQVKLVYTIDMETDVIEKITFLASNGGEGELRFSYLQDIDNVGNEFVSPRRRSSTGSQTDRLGMLWLVKLADGRW